MAAPAFLLEKASKGRTRGWALKSEWSNVLVSAAPWRTDVMGPRGSEMKLEEMFFFCVESKGYSALHLGCSFLSQSSRNSSLMPRVLSCLLE